MERIIWLGNEPCPGDFLSTRNPIRFKTRLLETMQMHQPLLQLSAASEQKLKDLAKERLWRPVAEDVVRGSGYPADPSE